jgi:GT2 family glycosyltransferase
LCNSTTLIKIIKKNNFGFAQGYNEALKHIDAEIYALEFDIEVTANWLLPVIETFKTSHKQRLYSLKY